MLKAASRARDASAACAPRSIVCATIEKSVEPVAPRSGVMSMSRALSVAFCRSASRRTSIASI